MNRDPEILVTELSRYRSERLAAVDNLSRCDVMIYVLEELLASIQQPTERDDREGQRYDPQAPLQPKPPSVRSLVRKYVASTPSFSPADVVSAVLELRPDANHGTIRAQFAFAVKEGLAHKTGPAQYAAGAATAG